MLRQRKPETCAREWQSEEKEMQYLDQQEQQQLPEEQQPLRTDESHDIERLSVDGDSGLVNKSVNENGDLKSNCQNGHGQDVELSEEAGERVECDLFDINLGTIHDVINVKADRLVRKAYEKKENAGRIVRKTIDTTKTWVVCHFNHLPKWMQDNEYLHVSHRPQLPSFKECFQSIFRMHSETGNIWTHLIGCLMFLVMAFYVVFTLPSHMFIMDKVMFGVFFLGAILCLGFSFVFHTVSCHSPKIGKLFNKLDYCGISLLITGSFVSCIYYMFYCDSTKRQIYLVLISFLCLSTIIVSLSNKFSEPNFRTVRASVFVVFGCSGVIPTIHWFISAEWPTIHALSVSFIYLIMMGVLYILGALLYAGRIPERFFPGKCDYWFQSHQIFHILVIAAAILHYQGLKGMATHRLSFTCDNVPITYDSSNDVVGTSGFFNLFG